MEGASIAEERTALPNCGPQSAKETSACTAFATSGESAQEAACDQESHIDDVQERPVKAFQFSVDVFLDPEDSRETGIARLSDVVLDALEEAKPSSAKGSERCFARPQRLLLRGCACLGALLLVSVFFIWLSVQLGLLNLCDWDLDFGTMVCGPLVVVRHQNETQQPRYFLAVDKKAGSRARSKLKSGLSRRGIDYEEVDLVNGLLVSLADEDVDWLTSDPPPFEAVLSLERDSVVTGIEDDEEEDSLNISVNSTTEEFMESLPEGNVTDITSREHLYENSTPTRSHDEEVSTAWFWTRRRSDRRRWTSNPTLRYISGSIQDLWYSTEWHLDVLDMKPGTARKDDRYQPANNAQDVDIYIVDTGVRASHMAFEGRLGAEHYEKGVGTVSTPRDVYGHGTAMAGSAIGRGTGSAQSARIVSVQVMGKTGEVSEIIKGLNWIGNRACDKCVVSMSLSGGQSTVFNNAVQNLVAQGYPVVVSAGNDGRDACLSSPASVSEALTVGALARYGDLTDFSNRGQCVDVFAPGENIRTSADDSDSGMAEISGTSPACAISAGVAAIYLQAGVPKDKLKEAIVSGATTWGGHTFISSIPHGIGDDPPPIPVPTSWNTGRAEVSTRRRFYTLHRQLTVQTLRQASPGEMLHCKMSDGKCLHGGCDADLTALSLYPRAHRRRRRRGVQWHAMAHSRSNTLTEDLKVEITHQGWAACQATPSSNHAEVTVSAGLA